ncbi:MAG TPA: helical backbone metal receptor [Gemmatimonadales bacterium]|nr:helical backbone metal receptor [Gemmatimonadales bacterium]
MRRWAHRTHLAGLLALAVAACAGGERPASRGGIAVTDDAGRRVTLAAPAQRIVSLLPSFTELLFAIGAGDRLVGRTTWCDYPPEALAVPNVGDGMPPNVEVVAARRPDLVVLYRSGPNVTAAEQLERVGIRTVLLDLNLLEDLGPAARRLGVVTGRRAAADSLSRIMDSLAAQPPAPSTQSLVFIVWDNPPIVIGAGSYLDRLAALAGARNVFHDIGSPTAQVSIETIAARDPDVVAVLSDSAVTPRYAARPEWRAVRAVREARFLFLPGQLFGRPGPRAAEAVRDFRRRLGAAP